MITDLVGNDDVEKYIRELEDIFIESIEGADALNNTLNFATACKIFAETLTHNIQAEMICAAEMSREVIGAVEEIQCGRRVDGTCSREI